MTTLQTETYSPTGFVKVPVQLFTVSPASARLYAAFLDFKAFNPQGLVVLPLKRDGHYYAYWMKKLCRCGWAVSALLKNKVVYRLKSYQEVWKLMGIEQAWCPAIKKYRFRYRKVYIADLPLERREYSKKLVLMLLAQVAGNKVRQIKYRLRHTQSRTTGKAETCISCRTIAKLFGLKSSRSGNKYRKMFFEIIAEPTTLMKFPDGTRRYRCKRIAL